MTGTAGSFQASGGQSISMSFSGALNNGVITGTFSMSGSYRAAGTEQLFPATSTQVMLTN